VVRVAFVKISRELSHRTTLVWKRRILRATKQSRAPNEAVSNCVRLKARGRVAQLVEQCPFKAWVEGSNPSALTRISKYLADLGGVGFGHFRTPRRVSTQLAQRFALSISRRISPAAPSGRPSCVPSAGRRKPLVHSVPRLSWVWCDEVAIARPSHSRHSRSAMWLVIGATCATQ
jgi:hypothetical protein